MNITLSPQIRLVALAGALAAVVMLGGLFFMMRLQATAEPEVAPAPVVQPGAPATPAPEQMEVAPPEPIAPPAEPAAPTPPAPAKKPAVAKNGLPMAINAALRKHRIVVVSLVVPGARLDTLAQREAQAGAKAAGVGFVSLNPLKEAPGRALAEKLGVVETPTLLVYRRPTDVIIRLEGFADRDTVAQAAVDARSR